MDTTILSAMAGVLGSLVGGSATVATAWITQKTLNRRELLAAESSKRENLYGEFINECSARVDRFVREYSTNRRGYYRSTPYSTASGFARPTRSSASGRSSGIHHGTILLAECFARRDSRTGARWRQG